jgi:hypothetical protein
MLSIAWLELRRGSLPPAPMLGSLSAAEISLIELLFIKNNNVFLKCMDGVRLIKLNVQNNFYL